MRGEKSRIGREKEGWPVGVVMAEGASGMRGTGREGPPFRGCLQGGASLGVPYLASSISGTSGTMSHR